MLTPKRPRDQIGAALDHFTVALRPHIIRSLEAKYGAAWWERAAMPNLPEYAAARRPSSMEHTGADCDPYLWLKIAIGNKRVCLSRYGNDENDVLERILAIRNGWAHGSTASWAEVAELLGLVQEALAAAGATVPASLLAIIHEVHVTKGAPRPAALPAGDASLVSAAPTQPSKAMPNLDAQRTTLRQQFIRSVTNRGLGALFLRRYACPPNERLVFVHRRTGRMEIGLPDPKGHVWEFIQFDRLARVDVAPHAVNLHLTTEHPDVRLSRIELDLNLTLEITPTERNLHDVAFRFDEAVDEFSRIIAPIFIEHVRALRLDHSQAIWSFPAEVRESVAVAIRKLNPLPPLFTVLSVNSADFRQDGFREQTDPMRSVVTAAHVDRIKNEEAAKTLVQGAPLRDAQAAVALEAAKSDAAVRMVEADGARAIRIKDLEMIAHVRDLLRSADGDRLLLAAMIDREAVKIILEFEAAKFQRNPERFNEVVALAERLMRAAQSRGFWH